MLTSKPFSTISYNTDEFLSDTLNKLVDEHKLDFWCYITHQPEDDETKYHKHLYMIPCGRVDTCALAEILREPDETHPHNPLGIIRCKSSKFTDWYLYALHDIDYLIAKGEMRKFHYRENEFIFSDKDYFLELKHTSDFSPYKAFRRLRDMVSSGVSFEELLYNGFIPIQQIYQYEKAYKKMRYCSVDFTYRGDRVSHDADPVE